MTKSASVPTRQTSENKARQARPWHEMISAFMFFSIVLATAFLAEAHWPYRYRIIKPMLEEVLGGQVTIAHYHRTVLSPSRVYGHRYHIGPAPYTRRSTIGNSRLLSTRRALRHHDSSGKAVNLPHPIDSIRRTCSLAERHHHHPHEDHQSNVCSGHRVSRTLTCSPANRSKNMTQHQFQ